MPMDPIVFLIVAAAVILIVVAIGLRVRSGEPAGRGPYSSSAESTGSFAAFGTTVGDGGDHSGLDGGGAGPADGGGGDGD